MPVVQSFAVKRTLCLLNELEVLYVVKDFLFKFVPFDIFIL